MQTAAIAIHADKLAGPLPETIHAIPSMMSPKERVLLRTLAEHEYIGEGVIMDAGVFCGASTVCFGEGIRANPNREAIVRAWPRPIRTFEYGVVNPGMIPFFERHGVPGPWEIGASFEPLLRANIAPVADLVELTMGDITRQAWRGEPIEIMFLDVLKSHAVQLAVMREFLPHLMPGGLLIQQDYFIDGLPFLKLMQEELAEYFDYLGEVQSSALFRLRKPVPAGLFASDPIATLAQDRRLALLDQARDRSIDPDRRLMCDLGKVRYLASAGEGEQARALLDTLPALYPAQFGERQLPRITMALRAATNRASGRTTPDLAQV